MVELSFVETLVELYGKLFKFELLGLADVLRL